MARSLQQALILLTSVAIMCRPASALAATKRAGHILRKIQGQVPTGEGPKQQSNIQEAYK